MPESSDFEAPEVAAEMQGTVLATVDEWLNGDGRSVLIADVSALVPLVALAERLAGSLQIHPDTRGSPLGE